MNRDPFEEFARDLEENKRNSNAERAEPYKLKNGDNRIVLLSNPVGYSELFGFGIAYEGSGYGSYATRRYKAYVLDMEDHEIKIIRLSYTTAKLINDLRISPRTAFKSLPCPYIMNLKTENAGKKEIKTSVLAEEDYELTAEETAALETYDPIRDIIERMKIAQKKRVENDKTLQSKIQEFVEAQETAKVASKKNKLKDSSIDTIDYDENEPLDLEEPEGEIPF